MSPTDNFRTNYDLSDRYAMPAGRFAGQISSIFVGFAHSRLYAVASAAKPHLQESRIVLLEVGQRLAAAFSVWRTRRQFRKDLSRILGVAPHMIADIGLTIEDAAAEAARPIWRA